jgi:hypothetical protein
MRPPNTLFAFQLFAAVALYGCGCFVPVTEKQCDVNTPCGSGWVCLGGVCHPPDGGKAGGAGGGGAGVGGGGAGVGGGGAGVGGGGAGVGGGGGACGGCRDATTGGCLPGTAQNRCGINGNTCSACQATQTCQNGACVNAGCTAANCPSGCCRNGVCVPTSMQTTASCGLSGQTCAACPAGQGCFFGKCSAVSTCNSTNCAGCCSGNVCLNTMIQTPVNCGLGGNACFACAAGQICTNGTCIVPTTCTAASCPGGCCDSGKCVVFATQSPSFCGASGTQCKQCPPGNTCSFGACVAPQCSPVTCAGCCTATGCVAGTATLACGRNGMQCTSCGGGQVCAAGSCMGIGKKIGDSCMSSTDCSAIGSGAYCKFQTSSGNGQYLGGFCTRPCSTDGGNTCTADSVCLNALQPYGENDAFCSPRCSNMNQCRTPGYSCYFINTVSTTACWLNPIPLVGIDAGVATDGGSIGLPCVNAGQCTNPTNAFCIQDVIPGLGASGFVGGYCSALCSTVPCIGGTSCQTVTGFSSGLTQQVCLRDCIGPRTGQSNCRNGYVCEGTAGTPLGSCLPRCNNSGATCPAGATCNTMSGYCN